MRRDKTGQINVRIGELATRTNSHWALLLSKLITDGETLPCYDGKHFFADDHKEGRSGVQSNKIEFDLADASVNGEVGTVQAPTEAALREAVLKGIQQIIGFKDDQGEPMNENASKFLVMVPVHLWFVAKAALAAPLTVGGASNPVKVFADLDIGVAANPRISGDKIYVFRADGDVKAFIRQEETAVQIKAKAEGSEYEFDHDAHQYGVDTWDFVNRTCMEIFGRPVTYRPKNTQHQPFAITGDFHKSYMEVQLKNADADISSAQIVLFVRLIDFPERYPKPLQGDYVEIWGVTYQVMNIEHHIPGSRKLVLHEQ